MFCKKCGREINDNVRFCTYCGNEVERKSTTPKKKVPKLFIALIAVGIAVIVGIIIVVKSEILVSDSDEQPIQSAIKDAVEQMQVDCMAIHDGFILEGGTEEAMDTETDSSNETESLEQNASSDMVMDEAYKQAYAEYLLGRVNENRLRFDMAMINEDAIPELLMIEDNSHANAVQIFTYYDGKVLPVIDTESGNSYYGSYGEVQYISRQNMIVSQNSGMGMEYIDFYSMDGHYAQKVCELVGYDVDTEAPVYTIDGIEVTQEEYERKYNEMSCYSEYELARTSYEDAMLCEEDVITEVFGTSDMNSQEDATEVFQVDVETEVEQIRTWYYDTQDRLESLLYASYDTNLVCYFDGAYPAKVVAKKGYNDWNVSREYYYHDGELYFIFVYGDIGEYRFYVKDGTLIRSISPDGNIVDYGNEMTQEVTDLYNRVVSEQQAFPSMVNCGA